MPDEGLRGPPPRRGVRRREARRLRRLRRHLRPDLPALKRVAAGAGGTEPALLAASRRQLIVEGLGIAVSAGAFGFVYGLSARNAGFSPIEAVAMSLIVFAGAAQFAAVGYVANGLAWPGVILLTALLNARHLLYSAALAPSLKSIPAPRRALMAHVLTDEAFALSVGHFSRIGRTDERGYWIAAIGSTWIPWNVATLAGVTIGGQIPDPARFGLDVVFPAAMIGLAVGLVAGRRELVAACSGAVVAVASSLAFGPGIGIIAGGLAGPLVAMAVPGAAPRLATHDDATGLP
ncbi:MAG: AzlC family ABC transporter permease [Chloroflexi bacterium]|nr:AzlC family ABC transporter permease [Chloroflexota bacterium]